jgi:hypothetical protein
MILFGTYQCSIVYAGDTPLLGAVTWILATVWEVFALCLAAWAAVKHFNELQQHSAGGSIGYYFTVMIKTHIFYFARCAHIVDLFLSFSAKGSDMLAFLLFLVAASLVSCHQTYLYASFSLASACHHGSSFPIGPIFPGY